VNFQPATEAAPAGYLKDAGSVFGVRTNGQSYGWNLGVSGTSRVRRGAVPIPELDTLIHMQKGGPTKTWEYALPNGSYPVIVVAGDPSHRDQTNNLSIEGIQVIDPDPSAPQGYEKGDFDGYAVQVTITDGRLTVQPGSGAVNAKICYVEIGAKGTTIDQATQDRLAALVEQATTQTAATVQSTTAKRQYVFGSYVDELVSYTVGTTRYFVHANHLYSPSAITNASGVVVERMRYDAYGKQTVTNAAGTVTLGQSAVGQTRGFTGYILDQETGLYHARARMYSSGLGRFVSRDPLGYVDGASLYPAFFSPNSLDPFGLEDCSCCKAYVFIGNTKTSKEKGGWSDPFGIRKLRALIWSKIDTANLKEATDILKGKYESKGYCDVMIIQGDASTSASFKEKLSEPCVAAVAFVGHGGTAEFPILDFGESGVSPWDPVETNACLNSGFFGACNSLVHSTIGNKTQGFADAYGITITGYDDYISSATVLAGAKGYDPPKPPPCCDGDSSGEVMVPSVKEAAGKAGR